MTSQDVLEDLLELFEEGGHLGGPLQLYLSMAGKVFCMDEEGVSERCTSLQAANVDEAYAKLRDQLAGMGASDPSTLLDDLILHAALARDGDDFDDDFEMEFD